MGRGGGNYFSEQDSLQRMEPHFLVSIKGLDTRVHHPEVEKNRNKVADAKRQNLKPQALSLG